MDNLNLAYKYFEKVLGQPINEFTPVQLSGWEVVEIVWPLNDFFRPKWHQINTLRYPSNFEKAANDAIERFVLNPGQKTWENLEAGVWRVLLERHQQLIQMAIANEIAGNTVITHIPNGLQQIEKLCGIMLLLLHSMKLPWPPEDRSQLEPPGLYPPASMKLH